MTHGDHCDTSRRILLSESNELILVKFYSVGTDSFEAPKEEEDPTHGVQRESEDHGLIRAFQLISQSEQINLVVFNLFAFNAWLVRLGLSSLKHVKPHHCQNQKEPRRIPPNPIASVDLIPSSILFCSFWFLRWF